MSIIFLKFVREIFAKFVQRQRMAAFRLPILSSLCGPQLAAVHVICILIWHYPEKGIYWKRKLWVSV